MTDFGERRNGCFDSEQSGLQRLTRQLFQATLRLFNRLLDRFETLDNDTGRVVNRVFHSLANARQIGQRTHSSSVRLDLLQ